MSEVTGNDPAAFCEIVELGRIIGNDVEKDLVDYGIELTLAGKLASVESCNNRGCIVGVGSSSSSTPSFMSGLGSVHRPQRKILWKDEAQHIVFATGSLVVVVIFLDFATSRRTAPLSLRSSWPLRARHRSNVPSPSANRPSLETCLLEISFSQSTHRSHLHTQTPRTRRPLLKRRGGVRPRTLVFRVLWWRRRRRSGLAWRWYLVRTSHQTSDAYENVLLRVDI